MASYTTPLVSAFSGTYRNPVHAGDFPDPSVLRVGDRDFYAVTTSTDWAPYFPIFRSRDLVNWTLVGHVFAERPEWCAGNFWAPDFAERDGRFYIYYTARRKDGGLCVAVATAERPEGPYTDHGPLIGQRDGSIDAMAVDDEHGDRWLLWKEDGNAFDRPTPIWAQRLSQDGIALLGEVTELLRNDAPWEGALVEAAHVVRHGDWFYMFYSGNACCGEACAYAVGVARSRSITGPWEKHPSNPILASNGDWRCPGHGAPVEDGRGNWYYMYHAYEEKPDAVYVGRQLCLDAIAWGADGWPSINGGKGPSRKATLPFALSAQSARRETFNANFSVPLDRSWQWPQSNRPAVACERGALLLGTRQPRKHADPLSAVVARPVTSGDYAATAIVNTRDQDPESLASLCAYGSHRDALGIGVRAGCVVLWRRFDGRVRELAWTPVPPGKIHLRLTSFDGSAYRFAYSRDGRLWSPIGGRVDGSWLPPWDAGVRVALAAGGGTGARASFEALRIAPMTAGVTPLRELMRRRAVLAAARTANLPARRRARAV